MSETQKGWGEIDIPESGASQFMRFEQGANKFRVVCPEPLTGFVGWSDTPEGLRPVRFAAEPTTEELAANDIRKNDKGRYESKFFMAMIVWNYNAKALQCLEITQKGIMRDINNFLKMPEYGSPLGYDLMVTRTGENLDTRYSVAALPPTPQSAEVVEAEMLTKYDLTKLLSGEYPFED